MTWDATVSAWDRGREARHAQHAARVADAYARTVALCDRASEPELLTALDSLWEFAHAPFSRPPPNIRAESQRGYMSDALRIISKNPFESEEESFRILSNPLEEGQRPGYSVVSLGRVYLWKAECISLKDE